MENRGAGGQETTNLPQNPIRKSTKTLDPPMGIGDLEVTVMGATEVKDGLSAPRERKTREKLIK